MNSDNMDKLVRITLVNWYLFDAVDIDIEGDSTLFRGLNGVGKSSILDAMQTVLSGGDENLIVMNAASSDGKRSGRTISSYALGEVAESPSHKASEPRTESNTYICLTFERKRDGGKYSIGVGFYVKKSGANNIKKYHFTIDKGDVSAIDFKWQEEKIMTWKMFEQRLQGINGKVNLPNTAAEFRNAAAELMSAAGARNLISSKMMFRSIKNGLAFKEEKSMSDFCRNYILPKSDINVIRIKNDFNEFKAIQDTIQDAKKRLSVLDIIIKYLNSFKSKYQRAIAYEWCEHEAALISADMLVEKKLEALEEKKENQHVKEASCEDLNEQIPDLQHVRDAAKINWNNSDEAKALRDTQEKIDKYSAVLEAHALETRTIRNQLGEIEKKNPPAIFSEKRKTEYEQARRELINATGMTAMDYSAEWPSTKESIINVQGILRKFEVFTSDIDNEYEETLVEHSELKKEVEKVTESLQLMSEGKASLSPSTNKALEVLKLAGIHAKPVCDLAKITDEYWQNGIESFLGMNREALVLLNDNNKPNLNSDDFELAIEVYRLEKKNNPMLRRAKLVNPEKLIVPNSSQIKGFAASLIESDNDIAFNFLAGLLKNVSLVESESELRKASRAISPDGMVVGNGTIGGGGRVEFFLIGKQARIDSARVLAEALKTKRIRLQTLGLKCAEYGNLKKMFDTGIPQLIESCQRLESDFDGNQQLIDDIGVLSEKRKKIIEAPLTNLKELFVEADSALEKASTQLNQNKTDIEILKYEIKDLENDINQQNAFLQTAGDKRKDVENKLGFSSTKSTECFEILQASLGEENYAEIRSKAQEAAGENHKLSVSHKELGLKSASAYATEYNVPDRQEMMALEPMAILERCNDHRKRITDTELDKYEGDAIQAQERMLHSFRSEIVAKLKENFLLAENTFNELNGALKGIVFNGNKYKFTYDTNNIKSRQVVYDYATKISEVESKSGDGLFATPADDEAILIIEEVLKEGRLDEISDYRNFYEFDLKSTSVSTGTSRGFGELLSKGSGGEKGTPFYVALGASFMTTYKIRMANGNAIGGAAIAVFDEAFSKIDGSNAKAALKFFEQIGLQVILAAPPESEIKVGPFVDKAYSIIRSGDAIMLDHKRYKPAAKELMQSDDPFVHDAVTKGKVEEVKKEFGLE